MNLMGTNEHELLKPVVAKIFRKPQKQVQIDFARALRASITWDTENEPPELKNAEDIFNETGVSIEDQVECGISLTRKMAARFLEIIGKVIPGHKLNRQHLNSKNYEEKFGRKVPTKGKISQVYTIAEVQYLAHYGAELNFPNELTKLLDGENGQ